MSKHRLLSQLYPGFWRHARVLTKGRAPGGPSWAPDSERLPPGLPDCFVGGWRLMQSPDTTDFFRAVVCDDEHGCSDCLAWHITDFLFEVASISVSARSGA